MNWLKDYLHTLEICRKALPPETAHVHYERLRKIERIVRRSLDHHRRRTADNEALEQWFRNDSLGG